MYINIWNNIDLKSLGFLKIDLNQNNKLFLDDIVSMDKQSVILKCIINLYVSKESGVLDAISVIISNHVTNEISSRSATISKRATRGQLDSRNRESLLRRLSGDFTIALRRNDRSPHKSARTATKGRINPGNKEEGRREAHDNYCTSACLHFGIIKRGPFTPADRTYHAYPWNPTSTRDRTRGLIRNPDKRSISGVTASASSRWDKTREKNGRRHDGALCNANL